MASVIPFLRSAFQPMMARAASAPERMVLLALATAKATAVEETHRRQEDLAAFADERFSDAMVDYVARVYPRAKDRINLDLVGHRYLAIVRMMARTLAVVFHAPPETWLEQIGTGRFSEAHPEMVQWRADQRVMRFGTFLRGHDFATVLHRTVLLEVQWVRGVPRWTTIRPYRAHLTQDRYDPTGLAHAPSVHVELPQPVDSQARAQPLLWESWIHDELAGAWRMFVHDDAGRLYRNPLFPEESFQGLNPYGLHPFTVWRDAEPKDGEFWLPERESWWTEQRAVNSQLMDLHRILKYQGFGVPFLTGWGGEDKDPTISPDEPVIAISREADFKFVTPATNIREIEAALDHALRRLAVSEGLPAETWSGAGATRNLGALKLLREPLEERRTEHLETYDDQLRQTFEIHKVVCNHHAGRGATRTRYAEGTRLAVRYAPLPEVIDPAQQAQLQNWEFRAGLTSPPELLASRLRVDREEAERRWRANLALNTALSLSESAGVTVGMQGAADDREDA